MQGTAAVVLAALMSACAVTKSELKDQRIVIFGCGSSLPNSPIPSLIPIFAGTAGLGIADGIRNALMFAGLSSEEARQRFWFAPPPPPACSSLTPNRRVLDRPGLLTTEMKNLRPGQENFVRDIESVEEYERDSDPKNGIMLLEVVKRAKPTIMIGCSTKAGAFSEEVSWLCWSRFRRWGQELMPGAGLQGDGEGCGSAYHLPPL